MSRPRLFCLNRCLVVRKGIAEMVADASTHAVMYQVEGTRRCTTIKDFLQTRIFFFFTTFIAYFRVFSPPSLSPLLSTSLTNNSHTNH